jgi:hypothetical protein
MTRLQAGQGDQLNQLALQGRSQAFNEAAYTRSAPINEITSLLSGSQVTQPNRPSPARLRLRLGASITPGLVNNNYNQQVTAANNAQMGGMFGLGGTLAAGAMKYGLPLLSDRRAKEDIRRVGETDSGIPIYTYRYKGSDVSHMGVLADEVDDDMKVMGDDGLFRVYYDRVH